MPVRGGFASGRELMVAPPVARLLLALAATALLEAAGGCAASDVRTAPASVAPAAASARATCYVHLPDTKISMAEFSGGVVLTYATRPNDIGTLRKTIRVFAEQQNRPLAAADTEQIGDVSIGRGLAGAPPGMAILAPGARATVSDVPGGARLTLAPVPEPTRELLRQEVGEHRGHALEHPRCPAATVFTPTLPNGQPITP